MNKYISTIISIIILIGYGWLYAWLNQSNILKFLSEGQMLIFFLLISLLIMVVIRVFAKQRVSLVELSTRYLRINIIFFMSFMAWLFDAVIYFAINHQNFIFIGLLWVAYTLFLGTFIGLLFPLVGIEGEGITSAFRASMVLMRKAKYHVYPGILLVVLFQTVGIWIPHNLVLQGIGYLSFPVIWVIYYGWMRDKLKNKVRYI